MAFYLLYSEDHVEPGSFNSVMNQAGNLSPGSSVTMMPEGKITEPFPQARPLWSHTFPSGDQVLAVSVNWDGTAVVAGTRYSHLYFFNRTGTVIWKKIGVTDLEVISRIKKNRDTPYGLTGIVVNADGNYTGIVSATGQNAYYFRNVTPVWGYDWSSIYSQGQNAATSDDGRYFVAGIGYGRNNKVIFYDIQHLKPHDYRGFPNLDAWHYTTYDSVGSSGLKEPHDPHNSLGVHVAISADGQYSAAVSEDSRVYFFNKTGNLLWNNITGYALGDVAMSSEGFSIAVASRDHNVYFFNNTGNRLWNFTTGGVVNSVAIADAGAFIAAGSADSRVYCINRDGTLLWNYTTGAPVKTVSMSRDGRTIVAGSNDHSVYCFDSSGSLLWKYPTGGEVKRVAVSADGNFVVAGSSDGNVYFFNREGTGARFNNAGVPG